jgi:asparagine synthase (glutamine-hydrolysing)
LSIQHTEPFGDRGGFAICGIAGVLDAGADGQGTTIETQLAELAHRGPDASGASRRPAATIGQTRLAVIDLRTGDPPILNEDGSIAVALNGEIYNFQALRDQLRRRGHLLSTQGDTEVLAHLAEDHEATELARLLDGMFAFAVWDERRSRLVLGRDRVGKKPLYYWTDGTRLAFASEIKALLAHPAVPRELDPTAIPAYLTFGYVPTPRTFFSGVRSVPPGHVLTMQVGGPPELSRYWEPPLESRDANGRDLITDARQVRQLLREGVARRLISDVPLGAFLSGGVDSSAVVGLMAEQMDEPVRTFTIGFDDKDGYDERPFAEVVARRFSTDHTTFVVEPHAVDLIERLVWHYDQPFGDSSAIPTYLLSELTREHVTVALSGDGGDELFAGYERFAAAMLLRYYHALPAAVRRGGRTLLETLPPRVGNGRLGRAQRFIRRADEGMPHALRSWISVFAEPDRIALLRDEADPWAIDDYASIWDASAGAPDLDRILDLNLRTYLLDDLLPKVDRTSMAHALEVRCPFLDTALIEYAFRVPPHHKLRGLVMKRVLKEAVRDLLPDELLKRRKHGFGVPLDRWFRADLRTYLTSMLGPSARVRAYLDGAALDRMLAEHDRGERARGHQLWSLLTLEIFLRREGW